MSYELEATVRDRVGKGAARALRRESKIPAVIYGDKQPPLPIALDYKQAFMQLHAGGFMSTVSTINVDGKKIKVIPKDYALDPVRDFLMHIDFLRITKGARLAVEVPVQFENEDKAPGIEAGGVLNIVRYTVELECPAEAIPENVVVDLTGLELGEGVHISSVTLPDDVVPTITDRDFTIATIAAPAAIREELNEEDGEEEDDGEEEAAAEEGEEDQKVDQE